MGWSRVARATVHKRTAQKTQAVIEGNEAWREEGGGYGGRERGLGAAFFAGGVDAEEDEDEDGESPEGGAAVA